MRVHAVFYFIFPTYLLSLPLQHQLIHGTATVEQNRDLLTITASDQTILHWQDFSIEESETTRFIMPNSNSSVLNRVIDAYPSRLLGKLEANGRVLLINPNGVLVGEGAAINTGSFIASSIDILDSAFLEGKNLTFNGSSSESVVNLGKINSTEGEVFLIGRHVENQGTIKSVGDVGMIASSRVLLKSKDVPGISIRLNQDADPGENFFSYAFHHNEATEADRSFAILSGEIHASGAQVVLLGEEVLLQGNAKIDVSSDFGGGSVLIGGDFQGKNPNISNSFVVKTWPDAAIDASTRINGDGGRVVLWADMANYYYGKISSEGGAEGGNGGFVEISSPGGFDFGGVVSTLAPNGKTGMLLLDPVNVTISGGVTDPSVALGNPTIFNMPPATVIINGAGLAAALALSNITIDTTNPNIIPPIPGSVGDISFITVPFAWAATPVGGSTLTLIANRNITTAAAAPINNSTTNGNIVMTAGATDLAGSITLTGAVNYSNAASTGFLTLNAPGNITTNTTGDITHAGTGGNIAITAGGTINLAGDIIYSNPAATSSVLITAGNGISVSSVITATTTGAITLADLSNAPMTITNTIQNAGTGAVTINRNAALAGSITIGNSVGVNDAAVGSSNGPTLLNAPFSSLQILATGTNRAAQVGFRTASGVTSTGPITVICDTLELRGLSSTAAAQIGHGRPDVLLNNSITTAAATITVTATNDITLNSYSAGLAASDAFAIIGHGSRSFDSTLAPAANQDGNITVLSTSGDIILEHTGIVSRGIARIGHGTQQYVNGGANSPNIAGDISVRAPLGEIRLLANIANNNFTSIGHGGSTNFGANSITSDIYVACLGDLTLDGITPGVSNQNISIGATYTFPIPNITQNIRVTAGGDIFIGARQSSSIGTFYNNNAPAISYVGDTEVIAGGDITLRAITGDAVIGINILNAMMPASVIGNVYVAAGGSINLDGTQGQGPAASTVLIVGGADVAVAAGGNITSTAGPFTYTAIGTSNRSGGGATTSIYANGNIIATNGATASQIAYLGYEFQDTISPPDYNVDIRAKGDIQMAADIDGAYDTGGGFIFIEADSCFLENDLWGYTGSDITSVCNIPFDPAFPITETNLLSAPIDGSSPQIDATGFGAFRVNTLPGIAANFITFETTSGNITVHSAPLRADKTTLQDLLIGGAGNNLTILTSSGNIDISGSSCRCRDGFNNIEINTVMNPWTSGTIYGRAATNLEVNTTVSTGASPSDITFISDCFDGPGLPLHGDITINADVLTGNGNISLSAGRLNLNPPCSLPTTCERSNSNGANIFHNDSTTVSCLLDGEIVEFATGSINLDNANITTAAGSIHLVAGADINIGSTIQNTDPAGEILLIANGSINLLNATALIDSPNPVTLVVDNAFPSSPLWGTGAFNMEPGSQIFGVPLQIFTSQQAYNTILGDLNGVPFQNGTLFENTSLEQWCIYFGCPFQRASFGVPYTLFYKICLSDPLEQAQLVVSEPLVSLHPYNEYPGWIEEFDISREGRGSWTASDTFAMSFNVPFIIRRRNLNAFNHPKTWTIWMPESQFIQKN